ncbi:MAG: ATP-binding protein [Bernardetiaceae bacterium]|nr:ATP-binding protein [Bernardetiaceae bacterium]
MKLRFAPALALLSLSFLGCGGAPSTSSTPETAADSAKVAPAPSDGAVSLAKMWETDTLLTTSEAVIFDPEREILYVSCIAGAPDGKDGRGYIAKVDLAGQIQDPQWVKGLNAPKGLGIVGDKLFVTDIDQLVEIDIAQGKILKKYPVAGAQFLNDVATSSTAVYFTDSNLSKIHQLTLADGKVGQVLADTVLGGCNGLYLADSTTLYVVGFDNGKLQKLDLATKQLTPVAEGIKAGDGLALHEPGEFFASSWTGQVRLVKNGQATLLLDTEKDKSNAADIWFVRDRHLLFVPTFFKNTLAAYEVSHP